MTHDQVPVRPNTQRRRSHARFEAALRVEYIFAERRVLALSRVLSEGGMLLGNSTSPLPPDTELDLHIQLTDSREPLQIRGRVLAITRRGTRVQFVPNQTLQVQRLRKFIVGKIIPTLLTELKRPDVNLRRVCELAELYVDYGRQTDALQLYRETMLKRGFDRMVCENMARVYIDQLSTATGDLRSRWIYELNDLCQRTLKDLPDSELLGVGRQLVQAHTAPPPLRSGPLISPNASPNASTHTVPTPAAAPVTVAPPATGAPAMRPPMIAVTPAAPIPAPVAAAAPTAAPPPLGSDKTRLAAYTQAVAFAGEYQEAELNAVRESMHLLHKRVQDLDAERRQLLEQLQGVRSELARERAEAAHAVRVAYEEKGLRAVRSVPLDEDEESALGVFEAENSRADAHSWNTSSQNETAAERDDRLHRRHR